MEYTLKLDNRTQQAKTLIEFLKSLNFIEITEKPDNKEIKEQSPYNPEFVKMIKEAEAEIEKGNTIRINPENVWESIL